MLPEFCGIAGNFNRLYRRGMQEQFRARWKAKMDDDSLALSQELTEERFEDKQIALAKHFGYLETAEGKALLDNCIIRLADFIDGELRGPSRTIKMPSGDLDVTLRRLQSKQIAFSALNALQQSPAIRPVEDYEDDDERMRDTREQMARRSVASV